MKLVDDWKKAHKWISQQCMALAVIMQATWAGIPEDLKANIPSRYVMYISIAILVIGMVGRVIDQGIKDDSGTTEQ